MELTVHTVSNHELPTVRLDGAKLRNLPGHVRKVPVLLYACQKRNAWLPNSGL